MGFESYLKQIAVIKTLSTQKDANQGVYQAWTTVATVKCLVQPWSGGVTREEEKDASIATHKVILNGSHDLSAKNQIWVGSAKYNVLKCKNWNSLGHHTTVECILETS